MVYFGFRIASMGPISALDGVNEQKTCGGSAPGCAGLHGSQAIYNAPAY